MLETGTGDADHDRNNARRKEIQPRISSHYRPSNRKKRKPQNIKKINKENGSQGEDSIRKEVVSQTKLANLFFKIISTVCPYWPHKNKTHSVTLWCYGD